MVLTRERKRHDEGGTIHRRADRGALTGSSQDEKPIATHCKEMGINEATFYAWCQKFGGMNTKEVSRLKEYGFLNGSSDERF